MTSLDTVKTFVKLQYIEKYWTKKIPADYPDSGVVFSIKFDSEEDRNAVIEMEDSIGTEDDVVADFIPKDYFLSGYLGTYNVNLKDEDTEIEGKVLLSPVQVNDSDRVVALHYTTPSNEEEGEGGEENASEEENTGKQWVAIDDVEVIGGYVYGAVDSLSPIALFIVKKDIEVIEGFVNNGITLYVCNGNECRVFKDAEDNKMYVENKITKKKVELTTPAKSYVVGGSADGSPIDTTRVSVEEGAELYAVYAGSYSADVNTTVKEANVYIKGATLKGVTGSAGKVHTEKINVVAEDTTFTSYVASGASIVYLVSGSKDANAAFTPETLTEKAPFFTRDISIKLKNCSVVWFYASASTGMSYQGNAVVELENVTCPDGGITFGASNGKTDSVTGKLINCDIKQFQATNRGIVGTVKVNIKDSEVDELFVGGSTDDDVTGVIQHLDMDIDAGTYDLKLGTSGGDVLTSNTAKDIVGKVKYSRSAAMTFGENVEKVLGDKLVIK